MHRFEELAYEQTPMGELTLRRRHEPAAEIDVFEVKLGEEFLMSSLFTVAEEALSDLGLAAIAADRRELDVLVGGLGLGYTAVAALRDERVRTLTVVDALPAVIDWHQRRLLPMSDSLVDDPRTALVHADFFALMRAAPGQTPAQSVPELSARFDAILLDVDHSPTFTLDPSHADLYTVEGLRRLMAHLTPGGVFGLWSDDPPEERFLDTLRCVFERVEGHTVAFDNPLTGGVSRNGVYVSVAPEPNGSV
jgi:spermidine synthase